MLQHNTEGTHRAATRPNRKTRTHRPTATQRQTLSPASDGLVSLVDRKCGLSDAVIRKRSSEPHLISGSGAIAEIDRVHGDFARNDPEYGSFDEVA